MVQSRRLLYRCRDKGLIINFQIGNWVTQVKENYSNYPIHLQIKTIIDSTTYIVEPNIFNIDVIDNTDSHFELWKPKLNEWCWFLTVNSGYVLGQYVGNLSNTCYQYKLNMSDSAIFNCSNCIPFIGELPPLLKIE